MTEPGIDTNRRRRLTRLREELGVSFLPPSVGYELRAIAPQVCAQTAARLDHPNSGLAISPEGRRQLIAVVARALDEFARVVENRPCPPPSVEALLQEIVHSEGSEQSLRALDTILATVREVMCAHLPQLPYARRHTARLEVALRRYADRLRKRIVQNPGPGTPRADTAPGVVDLSAQVEARWASRSVELYVSVATPGATCTPPQGDHRDTIRLVVDDHVVTVSTHAGPPPRSIRSPQPPIVVTAGPVPVDQVPRMHDTLLLVMRLIRAGVASPPVPVAICLPDLGFLRPSSDDASVQAIAELLRPLAQQGPLRRVALARTLQLRLRSATTSKVLAAQLGTHPQTICNHLAALRDLYNPQLDFGEDTLAIQAALDLVLPLWELELESAARRRSTRHGKSGQRNPPADGKRGLA